MVARQTYSERRWPNTPEFNSVLCSWKAAGSIILLELVWKGYDRFCEETLSKIDYSKEDDDLERDITQLLEPKIREVMTGYEPFFFQHSPYEHESRLGGSAQPPQYDIAFVLIHNDAGGPEAAAQSVREVFGDELKGGISTPLKELFANFEAPDSQGPVAYKSQMMVDHPESDPQMLAADAVVAIAAFRESLFP